MSNLLPFFILKSIFTFVQFETIHCFIENAYIMASVHQTYINVIVFLQNYQHSN